MTGPGPAYAIIGMACAVVFAGIGSSIGIGIAARVAAGALSEDPKNFIKYLLLVALPGTQGIYGFIIAFLLVRKLGILQVAPLPIDPGIGLQFLFAGIPVGLAGLVSAIHQGKVCAAGVEWLAKQPESTGQALVYAVFVEFYAVLGFLISFFLWRGLTV